MTFRLYSLHAKLGAATLTLLAGIFGYPISHSISPPMHQAAFDHARIDASYEAWETHPDDLANGVRRLRDESYLGANVTVPHKQAVIQHLDEVDELATRIGAVNTIISRDGRLLGTNTDAEGFITSLNAWGHIEPTGLDAVLLGAGGAARAAAHALADAHIGSLTIANRTLERAQSLVAEIKYLGADARAIGLQDAEFASLCARANLLVNSTSVGMLHGPAQDASPVPDGAISPGAVVYDMVYNPPNTPLLVAAEKAGARVVGGLPMLVYQGAAAWSRWTGKEAPIDVMFKAAHRALGL